MRFFLRVKKVRCWNNVENFENEKGPCWSFRNFKSVLICMYFLVLFIFHARKDYTLYWIIRLLTCILNRKVWELFWLPKMAQRFSTLTISSIDIYCCSTNHGKVYIFNAIIFKPKIELIFEFYYKWSWRSNGIDIKKEIICMITSHNINYSLNSTILQLKKKFSPSNARSHFTDPLRAVQAQTAAAVPRILRTRPTRRLPQRRFAAVKSAHLSVAKT